jgi:hypothetical protein
MFGWYRTEAYYDETFWTFQPLTRGFDIFTLSLPSIAIEVVGKGISVGSARFRLSDAFDDARYAIFEKFKERPLLPGEAERLFMTTLNNSLLEYFPLQPGFKPQLATPNTEFMFYGDIPISVIQIVDPEIRSGD